MGDNSSPRTQARRIRLRRLRWGKGEPVIDGRLSNQGGASNVPIFATSHNHAPFLLERSHIQLHTVPAMRFPSRCGIKVRVAKTYAEMSSRAADVICDELKGKPDLLLCLSAGGTPTGLYEELVKRQLHNPRFFSRFRAVGVDEWGGLPAGGPGTCQADLEKKLLDPMKIDRKRRRLFRSDASPDRECERMARWLVANGPIDLCILGLGLNGHVAMNEPNEVLNPFVHVAKLASSSSRHQMLKTVPRKPSHGLTLGVLDILCSRKIILLVSGETKRPILQKLLQPRVATRLPASLLWLHPDATVLCDRAALGANRL